MAPQFCAFIQMFSHAMGKSCLNQQTPWICLLCIALRIKAELLVTEQSIRWGWLIA